MSNKYILIQEEYGFRNWLGSVPTNMNIETLTSWWRNLSSVRSMFFNPSKAFPFALVELDNIAPSEDKYATWQWEDEKGVKHILDRSNVIAFFHVHEDDDSYMKVVGGDYIYHAGYGEDDEE